MNNATPKDLHVALGHVLAREAPSHSAGVSSMLLFNEAVLLRERIGDWLAVSRPGCSERFWVPSGAVREVPINAGPVYVCISRSTHGYFDADLRRPAKHVSMSTRIVPIQSTTVTAPNQMDQVALFQDASQLWFPAIHFTSWPCTLNPSDLAQKFIEVPYMYHGRSAEGIDAFGLVQVVCSTVGAVFYDFVNIATRFQPLAEGVAMTKGDIVKLGEVLGIYTGDGCVVYASDRSASVVVELIDVIMDQTREPLNSLRYWPVQSMAAFKS